MMNQNRLPGETSIEGELQPTKPWIWCQLVLPPSLVAPSIGLPWLSVVPGQIDSNRGHSVSQSQTSLLNCTWQLMGSQ